MRASRVLVMVPETATPEQKAAKKKAIDAARARVAKGEDFLKGGDGCLGGPLLGPARRRHRLLSSAARTSPASTRWPSASKIGVLSPVFETPLGYQFLKVTETRPAGVLALDDARPAIIENLTRLKVAQQEQDYVQKLLKDSNVKYNIPLTEPPARGLGPARFRAGG